MAARAELAIDGAALAISGVLDFDSVVDLDAEGRRWLGEAAPVECQLDLAGVTYSSSAGIALLLGWLRAAQHAQKHLQVVNIPADMAALMSVSGLEDVVRSA